MRTPIKTSLLPTGYAPLLADLKARVRAAQVKVALSVNRELILLYWHIGREILRAQKAEGWGAKVVERLAKDLAAEFPEMKGFSRSNMLYMRAFYAAWEPMEIVQQPAGQLGGETAGGSIVPQAVGQLRKAKVQQPVAQLVSQPISKLEDAPLLHGQSLRRSLARVSIRKIATLVIGLVLLWTAAFAADANPGNGLLDAGVGSVDITPTEPVSLAGSPAPLKSSSISSRLYARALVLSDGRQKAVIVTLDTLKYPVEPSQRARQQIEKVTGIPIGNIIICSSHTHRGPLWSYYPDQLVTPITDAVVQAVRDLSPCTLGMSKGGAEGVSECRRVIKDGHAWNRWQLKPEEADQYPAEGPADPEFDVLAVTARDGRHKAVVYNFACHAANTRDLSVSADFPADVQQHVQKHLGYEVTTLFLTGACGDINPIYSVRRDLFGEKLGGGILRCLDKLDPIIKPVLAMESREFQMPGREHPELKEAEIARNWPTQLDHYKATFNDMKTKEKPSYQYFITGIRIGDDFAIVTNANELFCGIAMSIKRQSPFKHTMTAEQTNGAHGYVPTAKAFEGGSYETWFGEHSYLTTKAGEIIERESLDILRRLKKSP